MKLPLMLDEYLDETEQDPETMTQAELIEEAKWVLWNYEEAEGGRDYGTPAGAKALKAFIRRNNDTANK